MPESIHSSRQIKLRDMLVAERKGRNLTQVELAVRLERPQSFVSKIETGERVVSFLDYLDIAEAIGFDPAKFLRAFIKQA
jgi:transcriptional regulator with XRE-family HTH domain